MNWWNIVLIIGFSQGLFLITTLITSRSANLVANRYLSILIFAVITQIAFELTVLYNLVQFRVFLRLLSIASVLLIGPSLYSYFKQIITPAKSKVKGNMIHFLPFLCLVILLIIIELNSKSISSLPSNRLPWYVGLIEYSKLIHLSTYFIMSFQLLRHFSKKDADIVFKNNSRKVILWFKLLLLFFTLTMIISLIIFVATKQFDIKTQIAAYVVVFILVIIIYLIAFMAMRFPITVFKEHNVLVVKSSPKYKNSSLTKTEAIFWKEKLLNYITLEKPFLNEKLKIQELANSIEIPTHYLSQIINQEFEKSFQDFINQYRVEEFKKRILDPKESHKTILGIAFESGFSSKASFNRIFKSSTGCTPKAYKTINS